MGPDLLCFCDSLDNRDDDSPDDSPEDRLPLVLLAVYPSYEWVPPTLSPTRASNGEPNSSQQSSNTKAALERAIHEYMQRLGRLPRPLSATMCQEHLELLGDKGFDGITTLTGSSLTRQLVMRNIGANAAHATVLLLMLCGHGGRGGELVLADGSSITMADVAHELHTVGFSGTLVCAINACHAEPPPLDLSAVCNAAGWNPGLPFSWVLMYSSGPEVQNPSCASFASHAAHFARLLGKLVVERPAYTELQRRSDELWVDTRDPRQRLSLWRGSPTICMGSNQYRGYFLGPIEAPF